MNRFLKKIYIYIAVRIRTVFYRPTPTMASVDSTSIAFPADDIAEAIALSLKEAEVVQREETNVANAIDKSLEELDLELIRAIHIPPGP